MTGRSYADTKTKAKTISYVCLTYVCGQASGAEGGCGYYCIQHEDAERLLLDKMESMGLAFDTTSHGDRARIEQRERLLGEEADELRGQWADLLTRGVQAYIDALGQRSMLGDGSPAKPRRNMPSLPEHGLGQAWLCKAFSRPISTS